MLNLKAIAESRGWKLGWDETIEIETERAERVWLYQVPCKYGHLWVYGKETLGAYTDRRRMIPRLMAIEGVKMRQHGDNEANVSFPVDPPSILDKVAELLQPRRKRKLTEEQRQAAAARLAPYHFSRSTE